MLPIKRTKSVTLLLALAAPAAGLGFSGDDEAKSTSKSLPSVEEARERAKILHTTLDETLQLVHDRFYRQDEGLPIPAHALKQVFRSQAERHGIELRWMAVDARPMNVDHKPKGDFEVEAVRRLIAGDSDHEQVADGIYRRAGRIELAADCLKCHQPNRSSNASRSAALVIAIPLKPE